MTTPISTRRSFRPTPAWLIFGLMVVECVLWLSERFQWFSFNEKKGWTVLIAVAVVGGVMLVMLLWFIASLLLRWRFQFSIRSLLLLVVAVALPCSWLAVEMKQAKEQREAAAAVVKSARLGGVDLMSYDYTYDASRTKIPNAKPSAPDWLRKLLLGDDFFADVEGVWLQYSQVTDVELEPIGRLTKVKLIWLCDTKVTDAGLEHLKSLTQLQELNLGNTQVTDVGLGNLKGLTRLQRLSLYQTKVTDRGVRELQQALPNCKIHR